MFSPLPPPLSLHLASPLSLYFPRSLSTLPCRPKIRHLSSNMQCGKLYGLIWETWLSTPCSNEANGRSRVNCLTKTNGKTGLELKTYLHTDSRVCVRICFLRVMPSLDDYAYIDCRWCYCGDHKCRRYGSYLAYQRCPVRPQPDKSHQAFVVVSFIYYALYGANLFRQFKT